MEISQRDVFILDPPFAENLTQHPFIVLSCKESHLVEGTFIGVMITSSKHYKDDYSFNLTDEMFESPLEKQDCHARMHLVTLFYEGEIKGRKINKMKVFYFKQLMKTIGELVFNYNFIPLQQ